MAGVKSNLMDIEHALHELGCVLDLTRVPRGRRRLADEAVAVVAAGILDRTKNKQVDANGKPLAPLKQRTLARKRKRGFPDTIGVQTGDMLAIKELEGLVAISPKQVTMIYGDNEEDRQKAEWFTEGKEGVQAPRPFYELSKEDEKNLDILFTEAADQGIRDMGGS